MGPFGSLPFGARPFDGLPTFAGTVTPTSDTKTGTGGIDPGEGLRRIVKPTGVLHKPKKGRKDVEARVEDTRVLQAEIAQKLAREFGDETAEIVARQQAVEVAELSAAEINYEIGVLLRKKIRTEEDELMLLLLMAAA